MNTMQDTIWIHDQYQSQYGLLSAMSRELHQAMLAKGIDARRFNLADTESHPESGTLLFMNVPIRLDVLPKALIDGSGRMNAIQYFVDHPFALPADILDEWREHVGFDNLTLALPCLDDTHLIHPRFPGLKHAWIPHGVPRAALIPTDTLTPEHWNNREFDVVVTGSVRPSNEIAKQVQSMRPDLVKAVEEIVALMMHDPHLGYVNAFDLVIGSSGFVTGHWDTQKYLWHLTIAQLNRVRRTNLVRTLQGLKVGVFGSKDWEPECTGTIQYAGEVDYETCANAFARARVAVAWGPTQFNHSYSERIMQAMAAGACVVADDRLLVRREFNQGAQTATLFDWSDPFAARRAVDATLSDPTAALEQAKRGRTLAEQSCLWENRVQDFIRVIPAREPQPA